MDEFVVFLQTKKTISHSSTNQYLTYIKSYLQYHDIDIVPYKFKKRVMIPKIPREEEELPIDENDIRAFLLYCQVIRLKTYLLVLASSGIRATEAGALRVRDINFDESPARIHVRAEYAKTKRS